MSRHVMSWVNPISGKETAPITKKVKANKVWKAFWGDSQEWDVFRLGKYQFTVFSSTKTISADKMNRIIRLLNRSEGQRNG